ncbi:FadR/GntR family transcriptional regulator [Salidesulfovibrio onnuriiensis]|uniref:FadR/GntR family transcriptional regulator n=1 Tax=Salidesulfovibrio onnuriiensis TaxID=2583823 RepID=UPI0011C8D1CC|nr:FadR/GntR family transcriptional regulator [Salidesulfovibrio onnuriiensis]
MNKELLDPIKKSRISEQVADKLEELILTRQLKQGEKLPSERKLMQMVGVGRGAVREALRILEIKGYIESKQGIGAFVKNADGDIHIPLSHWLSDKNEILPNIFEVRLILEPDVAALAAKRITPKLLDELRATHEEFSQSVEQGDLPKSIMADAQFHELLAKATRNKLLIFTMGTLQKSIIMGWKASLKVPGRSMKTVHEHEEILNAVASGDAHKASAVMRKHLADATTELQDQGMEYER